MSRWVRKPVPHRKHCSYLDGMPIADRIANLHPVTVQALRSAGLHVYLCRECERPKIGPTSAVTCRSCSAARRAA